MQAVDHPVDRACSEGTAGSSLSTSQLGFVRAAKPAPTRTRGHGADLSGPTHLGWVWPLGCQPVPVAQCSGRTHPTERRTIPNPSRRPRFGRADGTAGLSGRRAQQRPYLCFSNSHFYFHFYPPPPPAASGHGSACPDWQGIRRPAGLLPRNCNVRATRSANSLKGSATSDHGAYARPATPPSRWGPGAPRRPAVPSVAGPDGAPQPRRLASPRLGGRGRPGPPLEQCT